MKKRAPIRDYHATLAIKRSMEVRREEYLDYMTFRANQRPLLTEIFGPLLGLKEEWAGQGASPGEIDFSAFRFRRAMEGGISINTWWIGGDEEVVLEETEDIIIIGDRMGRRMKLSKKAATIPLPMDYPVKTMDDWRKIKRHYEFSEDRFGNDWERIAREHREAGRIVTVSIPGGYDEPRQLLGEEELSVAYYEQPELIHDILQTIGDTACRVLERVSATVLIDQLSVHDDMAGKTGPMIGPKLVEQFMKPYYRRVWELLQSRGAGLFKQDSDGDLKPILPQLLDCGINFMYPMEPAAGMDIVKVREQYGTRVALMGGIDKHVLRRSKEEIVAELEYKIPPMIRTGGCVLGLDHRIPNGTPLENYRFYIQKAWEILDREAAKLA